MHIVEQNDKKRLLKLKEDSLAIDGFILLAVESFRYNLK